MRRKNTKRFDPRYFMDEKIDKGAAFCAEQEMDYDEELGKCVPPKIQQPDPSEWREGLTDRNPADFHPDYLETGSDPQDVQRWNDTALPGLPRWVPAMLSKLGLARPFYQSDEEYEAALAEKFGEEMAMTIAAAEPEAQE